MLSIFSSSLSPETPFDVDLRIVEQFLAARHGATMLTDHASFVIIVAPVVRDVDGPEELFDVRHRRTMAIMIVAPPGVEPWAVKIENLRRKRDALGIKPNRIIDPDVKLLRRKRDGAAFGIVSGQELRLVIEDLGSEYALLEGDDFSHLFGGGPILRLRMGERSVNGLVLQGRFPAVPHDRVQESDIGCRHRTAVHRKNPQLFSGR